MEPGVFKNVAGGAAVLAVGLAVAAPAGGGDHFPIAGVYARDRACKGDGSDPVDTLVTITRKNIESTMGSCIILHKKREGNITSMQVQCRAAGDEIILGDVTLAQRDDDALDFDDQDHTSPAVLHKCGK